MSEIEESPVPPAVNNDICGQFNEYDRRFMRRYQGNTMVINKEYCREQLGAIDGSSFSSFRYSMLRIILLHTHLLTIAKLGLDNLNIDYPKEMRFYMIKRIVWFVVLQRNNVPMVQRKNGKTVSYLDLARDRYQYLLSENYDEEFFPKEERDLIRKLLKGTISPDEYYDLAKDYHL